MVVVTNVIMINTPENRRRDKEKKPKYLLQFTPNDLNIDPSMGTLMAAYHRQTMEVFEGHLHRFIMEGG